MIRLVYITTASVEDAKAIGRALVEERLAACVNILPGMHSIYYWEGKIETADEAVLIAKTTDVLVDQVIERVKALHGYKVPCVLSLPVLKGNRDYMQWLADAVQAPAKPVKTSAD